MSKGRGAHLCLHCSVAAEVVVVVVVEVGVEEAVVVVDAGRVVVELVKGQGLVAVGCTSAAGRELAQVWKSRMNRMKRM